MLLFWIEDRVTESPRLSTVEDPRIDFWRSTPLKFTQAIGCARDIDKKVEKESLSPTRSYHNSRRENLYNIEVKHTLYFKDNIVTWS